MAPYNEMNPEEIAQDDFKFKLWVIRSITQLQDRQQFTVTAAVGAASVVAFVTSLIFPLLISGCD